MSVACERRYILYWSAVEELRFSTASRETGTGHSWPMDYYMGVWKKIYFGLAILAVAFLVASLWPIAGRDAAAPVVKTAPHAGSGTQTASATARPRRARER